MQVIEEHAKFDLLLKLRRGIMEVKFRVEVNKNTDGKFYLGQFEQDNSWISHSPLHVLNMFLELWCYFDNVTIKESKTHWHSLLLYICFELIPSDLLY